MKLAVVASKLKSNGVEVGTHVSADLPGISRVMFELSGAGIMGTTSMPVTGQIEAMEMGVNTRGISADMARLMSLKEQRLELLFSQDSFSIQDGTVPEGCKIYATGYFQNQDGGSVVPGEGIEGNASFVVQRYEVYVDGDEIILIDQIKNIYRILGVDQMAEVRKATQ